MGWEVDDIEATIRVLAARGVVFEEYDLPGLRTIDGIAEIEGNYPSKGTGGARRLVPRQRRESSSPSPAGSRQKRCEARDRRATEAGALEHRTLALASDAPGAQAVIVEPYRSGGRDA
jgi:hypothetical protein